MQVVVYVVQEATSEGDLCICVGAWQLPPSLLPIDGNVPTTVIILYVVGSARTMTSLLAPTTPTT